MASIPVVQIFRESCTLEEKLTPTSWIRITTHFPPAFQKFRKFWPLHKIARSIMIDRRELSWSEKVFKVNLMVNDNFLCSSGNSLHSACRTMIEVNFMQPVINLKAVDWTTFITWKTCLLQGDRRKNSQSRCNRSITLTNFEGSTPRHVPQKALMMFIPFMAFLTSDV